jgi:hypothetical protein
MNPWWWVPIGLVAWFLVALAIALFVGPLLKRSSQAREALERQSGEMPDEPHEPSPDELEAS